MTKNLKLNISSLRSVSADLYRVAVEVNKDARAHGPDANADQTLVGTGDRVIDGFEARQATAELEKNPFFPPELKPQLSVLKNFYDAVDRGPPLDQLPTTPMPRFAPQEIP